MANLSPYEILTNEEVAEIGRLTGEVPIISPALKMFCDKLWDPETFFPMMENFVQQVTNCDCWHCLEMRKRPELRGYDLWLRIMRLHNGIMQAQLN